MSSFRRKLDRPYIKGTMASPHTGQIITGSGNPALDEVLGGGIPMNSIILIEEDKHCIHSKVLCKYFLSEGDFHGQLLFLGCLDESPKEILSTLPKVSFYDETWPDPDYKTLTMDTTSLRIAWRYNDLPYLNVDKRTRSFYWNHHFNLLHFDRINLSLSKIMWSGEDTDSASEGESPKQKQDNDSAEEEEKREKQDKDSAEEEEIEKTDEDVTTTPSPVPPPVPPSFFTNKRFQQLLNAIPMELRLDEFCRICIPSLGSPLWYEDNFGQDLLKFLTILRAIVQNMDSACFITMPMHLIAKNDETLVPKIRNLVDYSIELESFAGSDRETNPAFKDYSGLLHLRKMSAIHSLALIQQSDLAFKLRRNKFVIEKFHLPPESEVIAEQNAEDGIASTPAVGCGGAVNNLDF